MITGWLMRTVNWWCGYLPTFVLTFTAAGILVCLIILSISNFISVPNRILVRIYNFNLLIFSIRYAISSGVRFMSIATSLILFLSNSIYLCWWRFKYINYTSQKWRWIFSYLLCIYCMCILLTNISCKKMWIDILCRGE